MRSLNTLASSQTTAEIIKALLSGHFTVIELNEVLTNIGIHCPDDLARTLSVLRKKGLIHGEFSEKKSAWVYWADKE